MEFSTGDITELAYIIAESIYAQCDVDRNKYLLLEALINHRKNVSALSVQVKEQETLGKSTAG